MSLVIQCPKCKAKLRGPANLAGRMVRCNGCQDKFRVPGGSSEQLSPSDTQQLSVVGSSMLIPAQAIPAKPAPGTADNPISLDDLILEEAPKPAKPLPSPDVLSDKDLILEDPKPAAASNPFTFEEPVPESAKTKRRPAEYDDDEQDYPRKKPRREESGDGGPPKRPGYRQKSASTPWALIIGVGVALLAIGGGVTALVLGGNKKEEAKTKVEVPPPLPPESKPRPKTKGPDIRGSETEIPDTPGKINPPVGPPKKEPPKPEPPKKEPPKKGMPSQPLVVVALPPAPTGTLTIVAKPRHQVSLDVAAEKVRDLRVVGGKVFVATNLQPGFQGAGVIDVIRRFDSGSGAKDQREYQFEAGSLGWPRPFAASEEGLVAVVNGGPTKITAYDFDSGNLLFDKHDVFAGLTDRVGPIAALALAPERLLYVVDQAGTVDVWNLATRERQTTGTAARRGAGKLSPAKACLMNGGAALAVAVDGKVWVVNSTGAMVTSKPVALPDPQAVPLAIGPGDGMDRVAVAYRTAAGKFGVAALHPVAGTTERSVFLPDGVPPPTAITWAADTLLAVSCGDSALVFDLEEREITAYLKGTTSKAILHPARGAMWWLTADSDPKKSALVAAELPFDGYFAVRKTRPNRQPLFFVPQLDGLAK